MAVATRFLLIKRTMEAKTLKQRELRIKSVTVDSHFPLNLLTTNLRYPTFRVVQSATAAVLKREKNPAKPQKNPPLLYYIPHFFYFS